jgi:hypothetical protein
VAQQAGLVEGGRRVSTPLHGVVAILRGVTPAEVLAVATR